LRTDNQDRTFRQYFSAKFIFKNLYCKSNNKAKISNARKGTEVSRIPLLILPRSSKNVLEKLEFF